MKLVTRELTPNDYELLLRLDESVPKRNVMSADDVSAALTQQPLPAELVPNECSICVDELEEGEAVNILCCGHIYHPACIHSWLTTGKNTCPMCGTKQCAAHQGDS